ncbi:hypothetical protein EJB05_01134, partial [Eragrostis curvula]
MEEPSLGLGSSFNVKISLNMIFNYPSRDVLVMYPDHSKVGRLMQGSTGSNGTGRVQVISRRVFCPEPPPPQSAPETVPLTPWDLKMTTCAYIQKGVLLPKPNLECDHHQPAIDRLASAFARALGVFHPFAGRLVRHTDNAGVDIVSLRCTGEGAEFVHAVAASVLAVDITTEAPLRIPQELVSALFPLNGLLGVYAISADDGERAAPLLAAQVTELADAVSLNHGVGDGTTFWHFVNTWSDLSRRGGGGRPPTLPVLERWFLDTCPMPVPLQLAKVEDAVRRCGHPPPLEQCFFHFSAESVKKLKARANGGAHSPAAAAVISSLQALLGHLWRSLCRARRLPPSQETTFVLLIGCRGRVKGVPLSGYIGNAIVDCHVKSTAGEVLEKGLEWTARLLNRAVRSYDDSTVFRKFLERWPVEQRFAPTGATVSAGYAVAVSSPRFDVYGNDFGWGKPLAVRSDPGQVVDGKCSVFQGRGGGGAMAMEVCLAPDAMARLVADQEFMDSVSTSP